MIFMLEESIHITLSVLQDNVQSSTSSFSIEICPACLFLVLAVKLLNRGKEYFLIRSCIECVRSLQSLICGTFVINHFLSPDIGALINIIIIIIIIILIMLVRLSIRIHELMC